MTVPHFPIHVRGLTKRYGKVAVVDDVSFEVNVGEIFGLLGPNGAGKTTTMECLEGIRTPDAGEIRILGIDPHRNLAALQQRIGVQLQQAELQKRIKVWEAADLMARLYDRAVDWRELLVQLGLAEKLETRFMNLSGGQKQRLFIALALINDPELVFFDELTTGLDPQARRVIWNLVFGIRERGKTVFLTTHLMEEAERLCDRVAIIDHGKVIDVDTPGGLVKRYCPEVTVTFRTADGIEPTNLREHAPGTFAHDNGAYTLTGQGNGFVSEVIQFIAERGLRVTDFDTRRSNLEDVFLKVTGHTIRDE